MFHTVTQNSLALSVEDGKGSLATDGCDLAIRGPMQYDQ